MSEQAAPAKIFSGLNIPKVLAGALAAVTVAVLGSFLGVAGTLAGAAIASVVGSVGTEVYERSIKHGAKKLQTVVAPTFVKAPAAVGTPEVAAAHEEDSPSHTVPADARQRQIRWGRVAGAAIGVFVLAMGAITVFELISGETVAGAVGATSNTSGTSLFGGSSKSSGKTPVTTPSSTPTDQPTSGSSADPQVQATTPSPQASTPADTGATTAPATDAPTQTTDPGTGTGTGSGDGDSTDSGTGTGNGSTGDGRLVSPGSGGGAGGAGQTTQGSGS
jgi:hypothetical protein